MKLQTSASLPLDFYYSSPDGISGGEDEEIMAEKLGINPYETEETIYYFCKHLALPGITGVFLPLLFIFVNGMILFIVFLAFYY